MSTVKPLYLRFVYEAARDRKWEVVRGILNHRLFTVREAQLYCEVVKKDKEAADYIYKQSICHKCGGTVDQWQYRTKPTCRNCVFRKEMEKVEFNRTIK